MLQKDQVIIRNPLPHRSIHHHHRLVSLVVQIDQLTPHCQYQHQRGRNRCLYPSLHLRTSSRKNLTPPYHPGSTNLQAPPHSTPAPRPSATPASEHQPSATAETVLQPKPSPPSKPTRQSPPPVPRPTIAPSIHSQTHQTHSKPR